MRLINKIKNIKKNKHPWDKFYTKDNLKIEVTNKSIYEHFLESANKHLNTVALNYFGTKISFKTLINKIDLCARALKSQGIREGDVVTICMANTPEAIIAFYAVNKIGAISNMIHPLSAEEEIKDSLISTKSVMLITINVSYKKIKNIINKTNVYKVVIVSPSDSMPSIMSFGYYITQGRKIEIPRKSEENIYWEDFIERGKNYREDVLVKTTKSQPALILHSGGTTGKPKNIVLTNGNVNIVAMQGRIILPEINESDSMLAILPIFHCFGLVVCIHAPLCLGACVIPVPQFDAKRFDKLLVQYKPTIIAGVPTLFEAMINNKHMDNINMSNVKYVISGGDTLTITKNERVNEFLKQHNCKSHVIQGYGLTETTGPVCFGALGSDRLGSVGIPLPGNDIKIFKINTEEEVETNEIGEICVSGPSVMSGYLDNEQATNEILHIHKDNKVWVHTGDLGYISKEGVVYFTSRLKRMLIVSGYNVYPDHIEDVMLEHPLIINCCVVGIPHPYKVEVPKAYIVLKNGIKPTREVKNDIKEYCEKNLSHYMIPKEFVFRQSLPKTIIGKVDYRVLSKEN